MFIKFIMVIRFTSSLVDSHYSYSLKTIITIMVVVVIKLVINRCLFRYINIISLVLIMFMVSTIDWFICYSNFKFLVDLVFIHYFSVFSNLKMVHYYIESFKKVYTKIVIILLIF